MCALASPAYFFFFCPNFIDLYVCSFITFVWCCQVVVCHMKLLCIFNALLAEQMTVDGWTIVCIIFGDSFNNQYFPCFLLFIFSLFCYRIYSGLVCHHYGCGCCLFRLCDQLKKKEAEGISWCVHCNHDHERTWLGHGLIRLSKTLHPHLEAKRSREREQWRWLQKHRIQISHSYG